MTETDLDISAYTSRAAWETVPDLFLHAPEMRASSSFERWWSTRGISAPRVSLRAAT